jgi:Flp pilus assembly pilin Flp
MAREQSRGQSTTEYTMIRTLIAIVAVVALTLLGVRVATVLSTLGSSI